jgi:hypothetical protein
LRNLKSSAADGADDFAGAAAVRAATAHDAALAVAQRANIHAGARRAGRRFIAGIEDLAHYERICFRGGTARDIGQSSLDHVRLLISESFSFCLSYRISTQQTAARCRETCAAFLIGLNAYVV